MFAEGFILITGAILTQSPIIRSQPSNVQTFKRLQLPTFNLSPAAQPSTARNRSSKKIIRITKNEYLPSRPPSLIPCRLTAPRPPSIVAPHLVSSNPHLAIRHSQFLIRNS
jgi:hypothetical protein